MRDSLKTHIRDLKETTAAKERLESGLKIARNAGDVGEALAVVNQSLCRENEAGMFVTVFAGVFDPSTGKLRCAAGGHDPPALLPGDGTAPRFLDIEGGPLLGLLDVAEYPFRPRARYGAEVAPQSARTRP